MSSARRLGIWFPLAYNVSLLTCFPLIDWREGRIRTQNSSNSVRCAMPSISSIMLLPTSKVFSLSYDISHVHCRS